MIDLVMTPLVSQIRLYVNNPNGYAERAAYQAIITVSHTGGNRAYLSGAMGEIDRDTLKAALKLLAEHGITEVTIERRGKFRSL